MSRAIILARASDPKQIIKGDTLDDQIYVSKKLIESKEWILDEIFSFVESGRKSEKEYFWKIFNYCKERVNTPKKIDYLVVKNLSRFNRGGGAEYLYLKKQLASIGVKIQDTLGTIGTEVNTLENLGFEYEWSKECPTEANEVSQAEGNLQYVRNQLTQMIGSCIRYIQKGYWNGPAPYGLVNKKVETLNDGLRNILADGNNNEAFFIKKTFEMRADGVPDTEIAKKINSLGFKTRVMVKRDKITKKKIGTRGGVPLTPKKIQEWAVNPIYCGVIVAKWTHFQPVKAEMYDGIVSVETFNRASRGKVYVIKNKDGTVQVKYNIKIGKIGNGDKRLRNNPKYPFKSVVCCPVCGKELKASGSRGRSGEKFHYYFCDRKHPRWYQKISKVDEVVTDYVSKLKYSDRLIKLFEESFMEVWKNKRVEAVSESELAEKNVTEIACEQKNVLQTIKEATSDLVKKALEKEYEELESKLKEARRQRNDKESDELDIKSILDYVKFLMEHPKELLIDRDNMLNQRQMFGTVFEELPTYDNLVSGTAKLQPIFQLKKDGNLSKSDLVQRIGVEPTLNGFTDRCLTVRLPLV